MVPLVSQSLKSMFFLKKNLSLSDCMSSKPVNSKKCKKTPTFHTIGNSFYCVMWPEGTTSLSGRRSWNVRTVLLLLSNVRNMYEQLRNGCSLSRKWLGHPERILMMLCCEARCPFVLIIELDRARDGSSRAKICLH